MTIENLIRTLQGSIAPCVLISGLGLLLVSLTNRFIRPVDRIRQLCRDGKDASPEEKLFIKRQVKIFYTRCKLLRMGIGLTVLSIFFVSTIMLMLFSSFIFNVDLLVAIELAFILSLFLLIAALLFFFLDIRLTLRTIDIEAEEYLPK